MRQWRLFLDKYDPTYLYLQGKYNVLAGAFSRVPRKSSYFGGKSVVADQLHVDLHDCFLIVPAPQEILRNLLDMAWLQENQIEDLELNRLRILNSKGSTPKSKSIPGMISSQLAHCLVCHKRLAGSDGVAGRHDNLVPFGIGTCRKDKSIRNYQEALSSLANKATNSSFPMRYLKTRTKEHGWSGVW